ncbi:MAG: DUF6263 family protein [Phycisphaerales bacterium]
MRQLCLGVVVAGAMVCGAASVWAGQPPAKKDEPTLPGAQLVDLRPKFEKGQRVGYVMKIRNNGEIGGVPGGDGKPTKTSTEQEIGFVMKVVDADREKGATVEMVYETIKFKGTTGLGEVDFDSTKPAKTPARKPDAIDELIGPEAIDKALRGMVGTTLTLTIDPSGKITSVKGGEKLGAGDLIGQLTGVAPDPKSLGGLFGPITSRGGNGGQAKVGEKWSYTDTTDIGPLGSIKMTTEHQLRGVHGNLADVFFTGRIEPQSDGNGAASPLQLKDTVYKGQYVWDTKMGWLDKMTSEQRVTIDGKSQGLPGTSKMETAVTVERKKGK